MSIWEYRRDSESETECHRLKAVRTSLLEISVWEPSGEKRFVFRKRYGVRRRKRRGKPGARVADQYTKGVQSRKRAALN